MLEIIYTKVFIKKYSKLNKDLQSEVKERIEDLRNTKNHDKLKVHKLKKPFSGKYAFSVNYKIRIIFEYDIKNKKIVILLTVGSHDVYKNKI